MFLDGQNVTIDILEGFDLDIRLRERSINTVIPSKVATDLRAHGSGQHGGYPLRLLAALSASA